MNIDHALVEIGTAVVTPSTTPAPSTDGSIGSVWMIVPR